MHTLSNVTSLAPLNLKDSRPRVFCLQRHVRFVYEWLGTNLNADVRVEGISHPEQLLGLREKTFVIVSDVDMQSDRESDSIGAIAAERGFTLLTIDDFPKRRSKYQQEHQRGRHQG